MKLFKKLLGATVLTVSLTLQAIPCICERKPPPCYEFGRNEVVFIGQVTAIEKNEFGQDKVKLSVEKSFKGASLGVMHSELGGTSCDFESFALNRNLLIYGRSYGEGKNTFVTSYCSRSTEFSPLLSDMEFLNRASEPANRYLIWGTLSRRKNENLSGIRAQIVGSKDTSFAISDEKGNLRFQLAAAGEYTVRVFAPRYTMLDTSTLNDLQFYKENQFGVLKNFDFETKKPFADFRVRVDENKCGWFHLPLEPFRTPE